MRALAFVLLGAALPSAAHMEYPIEPVRAVLRVEPDRVVVDLRSDSVYWIEEIVGLRPMPPSGWSAETRAKIEAYVNSRLRLSAGGQRLPGRLVFGEYVQRLWEVNEQGELRLRMSYPAVSEGAISGEADFFEEHRLELAAEYGARPWPQADRFKTLLSAPGAGEFVLEPGKTAFSLDAARARRGPAARARESMSAGTLAVLGTASAWPALLALALSLGPGLPPPGRAGGAAAAALAGALLPGTLPGAAWAAGLAAALAAGRWLPARATGALEAAAALAAGKAWGLESAPWLPKAAPGALELAFSAAGALAAAAALLALALAGVAAFHRELVQHSESRAPELYERRRRLAATALVLVCGYGLAQAARWAR